MPQLVRAQANTVHLDAPSVSGEKQVVLQAGAAVFEPPAIGLDGLGMLFRPDFDARAKDRAAAFQVRNFLRRFSVGDMPLDARGQFIGEVLLPATEISRGAIHFESPTRRGAELRRDQHQCTHGHPGQPRAALGWAYSPARVVWA
jgi:hypothetical protein